MRAVEPRRPIEAKSAVIHYTVYASPEQITRFTGQTSNGKIDIQASFNGYLDLNSSNGSIVLKDGEGIVNLSTLNGSIKFERLILTDSSSVKNSNGTIKGSVVLPQTGEFLFTTLNGLIDLRMPGNTLGDFKLHTSNGKVSFRLGSDNISGRGSIHVRRAEQPVVSIRTLDGKVNVHEE